ncbi:ABC transporter substrate-binding protein [Streptomyces sp. TRM68367]|uniref:ABC transporter substrate-binding protein n=1 Tax=Streptomyces sp. TRM68367 TaxID=2758415 RepID=UPI00165C2822|nr:ABC transporter substrate-binding protein [Streptomyces sp. TRM68367]MBC9725278.1 ABC transporter substrate-binding protein [Streptomyces sp. TRM68367]
MLLRLFRRHPREWGPVEWLAGGVVVVLVVGALVLLANLLQGPGRCGADLKDIDGDCVGVTARAFEADPAVESLIDAIAAENARVQREWADPQGNAPRIPYVRIALMMPFTADEHSAMTTDMIRRALAGSLTAQLQANRSGGPHYQLLLAPDGRNLRQWPGVVERLAELAADDSTPLVGVTGTPSSTEETREAIDALSEHGIPTVGPVITATDMNSRYFFKTSPNNDQLARALMLYVNEHPGQGKGFLVWDNRTEDVYSQNLREVFERHFGKKYRLDEHNSNFTGTSGTDKGIPQRFTHAVTQICTEKADTVLFAGRDQDLPAFIERLARAGDCGRAGELRILKVGIGLEPTLSAEAPTRWLAEANATIVDASSVDPAWWKGENDPPAALGRFLNRFEKIHEEHKLGPKALDDGYAVMYHDAFVLLADAVDRTFADVNEGGKQTPEAVRMPTKDDVYNTLILPSVAGDTCSGCLRGAAGTYGFEGPGENDQWAVCKPVPLVLHPSDSGAAGREPLPLLRTFRGASGEGCPKSSGS